MCMSAVSRLVLFVLFVTAALFATYSCAADTGGGAGKVEGVQNTKEYGDLSLSLSLTFPPGGGKQPSVVTTLPSTETQAVDGGLPSQKLSEIQAQIDAVEKLIETRERFQALVATGPVEASTDISRFVMPDFAVDQQTLALVLALSGALLLLWYVRRRSAHAAKPSRYHRAVNMLAEAPGAMPVLDMHASIGGAGQSINIDVESDTVKQSVLPPEFQALEEADIYLRFGHVKLAEEALSQAIKLNPQNAHAYLKLLRIYFSREERGAFETLARQLHELDDAAVWKQAIEMGQVLDPDNSLYH